MKQALYIMKNFDVKNSFDYNNSVNDMRVIFKSSNIEAMFIAIVWITSMFLQLLSFNGDYEKLSAKITTINITGMFVYLFILILNLLKYSLLVKILNKITKNSLKSSLSNVLVRNLFIIFVFLIQFVIFMSFFYFNLFENYKIISGSAKDWMFLSFGILVGKILGIIRFIVESLSSYKHIKLKKKEIKAIEDAIEEKRDKITYFN